MLEFYHSHDTFLVIDKILKHKRAHTTIMPHCPHGHILLCLRFWRRCLHTKTSNHSIDNALIEPLIPRCIWLTKQSVIHEIYQLHGVSPIIMKGTESLVSLLMHAMHENPTLHLLSWSKGQLNSFRCRQGHCYSDILQDKWPSTNSQTCVKNSDGADE